MLTLAIILTAIAAVAKGFMDAIKAGKYKDHPFWGHDISQRNKWKLDENGKPMRDKNGKLVPKHWGSSTFFAFLYSGWHLMQFFVFWAFAFGVGAAIVGIPFNLHWTLDVLIVSVAFRAAFGLAFGIIQAKHYSLFKFK